MIANTVMADLYQTNCESLGWRKCEDKEKLETPTGSTDMGNVSHVVPSIHPHYYITDVAAHTHLFKEVAG